MGGITINNPNLALHVFKLQIATTLMLPIKKKIKKCSNVSTISWVRQGIPINGAASLILLYEATLQKLHIYITSTLLFLGISTNVVIYTASNHSNYHLKYTFTRPQTSQLVYLSSKSRKNMIVILPSQNSIHNYWLAMHSMYPQPGVNGETSENFSTLLLTPTSLTNLSNLCSSLTRTFTLRTLSPERPKSKGKVLKYTSTLLVNYSPPLGSKTLGSITW